MREGHRDRARESEGEGVRWLLKGTWFSKWLPWDTSALRDLWAIRATLDQHAAVDAHIVDGTIISTLRENEQKWIHSISIYNTCSGFMWSVRKRTSLSLERGWRTVVHRLCINVISWINLACSFERGAIYFRVHSAWWFGLFKGYSRCLFAAFHSHAEQRWILVLLTCWISSATCEISLYCFYVHFVTALKKPGNLLEKARKRSSACVAKWGPAGKGIYLSFSVLIFSFLPCQLY